MIHLWLQFGVRTLQRRTNTRIQLAYPVFTAPRGFGNVNKAPNHHSSPFGIAGLQYSPAANVPIGIGSAQQCYIVHAGLAHLVLSRHASTVDGASRPCVRAVVVSFASHQCTVVHILFALTVQVTAVVACSSPFCVMGRSGQPKLQTSGSVGWLVSAITSYARSAASPSQSKSWRINSSRGACWVRVAR